MRLRRGIWIIAIVLSAAGLLVILAVRCGSKNIPIPTNSGLTDSQIQVSAPEPTLGSPTNAGQSTKPAPEPTDTLAPTPIPPTGTPEPTSTPTPADTPAPVPDAIVNADILNFRAGPGTNYDIIGQLKQGDPLSVSGKNAEGDWLSVTAQNGAQGWVFATFATLNIDLSTVAVAQNIPPTPTAAPAQAPSPSNSPPPAMPPPLPAGTVPGTSPLTGLPTDKAALAHRPVLVRVGNDPVARSIQAGLSQADVVYEEIMDGWGVTRYTAVFWSQDAPLVRPVRSARLVSIDLAKQYQGALAHSGASDPIRLRISQSPIVDLDEFYNHPPYTYGPGDWRTRLYTSLPRLHAYLQAKGLDQPVGLESWAFSDQPLGGSPASTVTIPYPNGTVIWQWDAGIGRYRRFIGGSPDVDANTGQQITAANVILLYAVHAKTDIVEDSLGNTSIDIQLQSSGQVKIVRDGAIVDGTWQRTNEFQPTKFSVPLKPGNSWVELIPIHGQEYHPVVR